MRARQLGVVIGEGQPGPSNAITDVTGVQVGHCTLVEGDGPLGRGVGPVRTGVTVVVPAPGPLWSRPVFGGCHRLNGNGELTGLEWLRESGLLTSPIGLTNTHSVGVVRDALAAAQADARDAGDLFWALPVVGETWDGVLNDLNGQHVTQDHVRAALAAADRSVREGSVGAGTGMICHGFKGGIGTASRLAPVGADAHTVGVLVLANHGRRARLTINGVPVGLEIDPSEVPLPDPPRPRQLPEGSGSIIIVVATDAPLLPHQCTRLAQRAGFGIARTGGTGEHHSGDLIVAFATGNRPHVGGDGATAPPPRQHVDMLTDVHLDALFDAVIEATEEAIVNTLTAARTMVGRDGVVAHGLPHDRLVEILDRYGRRSALRRLEHS